jgi:ADP-ribose pyrophosphatase YjhB (NUDIX family)
MTARHVFVHHQQTDQREGDFKFCPVCGASLILADLGGRHRPTCQACGYIQFRNPAPTVSVLIVRDDKVLLGRRHGEPGRGTWSLPSGYIEWDDDLLLAAVREAKEETGLDVELTSMINVVSSLLSPRYHFLGIYFAARVLGGELSAGDDLDAVAWFPLAGPMPELGFEEDAEVIRVYNQEGYQGMPVSLRMEPNRV